MCMINDHKVKKLIKITIHYSKNFAYIMYRDKVTLKAPRNLVSNCYIHLFKFCVIVWIADGHCSLTVFHPACLVAGSTVSLVLAMVCITGEWSKRETTMRDFEFPISNFGTYYTIIRLCSLEVMFNN